LDETRGRVVVVDGMSLSGIAEVVVGVLGPPVLGWAVAANAGRLKAMTVAMMP